MPEVTTIGLILFMLAREVMHYLQVVKLQELLKSVDVTEYYKARSLSQKPNEVQSPSLNQIMDEENEISAAEEPEWDIRKVTGINVDGVEKPIRIY